MAWTDAPTMGQLTAWRRLVMWALPNDMEMLATQWIKEHKNRKELSDELGRARDLYIAHKLNKYNCFDSPFWDGFEHKDKYKIEAQAEVDAVWDKIRQRKGN